MTRLSPQEHLERRITPGGDGCWEWQGALDRDGYGFLTVGRKYFRAHRLAYEVHVGPIPTDLVTDHLCRNRACVNPAHLEIVTRAENLRRSAAVMREAARQRRTCKRGHLLDEENTYVERSGYRRCRACKREAYRRAGAA